MAGTAHTRQLCGWLGQSRTLLTSIHRPASDHILHSGFDVSGEPDIPKLSAGKGLSSLTMNSSTRHQHSSREVFVGKWKRHHGRVGIARLLCHHLIVPIGFKSESSFWLLAPCVGVPDGFTFEKALRFSSSFSSGVLHLSLSSSVLVCLTLVLIFAVQR